MSPKIEVHEVHGVLFSSRLSLLLYLIQAHGIIFSF